MLSCRQVIGRAMPFDHRPDRPVPPRDNRQPGHRRPAPWLRETRVERLPARPQRGNAWDSEHAHAWDSSHAKPAPGLRKALIMSGILGGAMVLAIALVAVVVLRNG